MAVSLSTCRRFKQQVLRCVIDEEVNANDAPGNRIVAAGHRLYYVQHSRREVDLFTPETNRWQRISASGSGEYFGIQHAWLNGDKLFVFGVSNNTGGFRYFDLVREEWVIWDPAGERLGDRMEPGGALHEPTSQYFIFGGRKTFESPWNADNELFAVCQERQIVYKPNAKGQTPSERCSHAMCAGVNHVFVYGGNHARALNDIHCLRISGSSFLWSEVKLHDDLPPRHSHAVSYMYIRIFVYGGGVRSSSLGNRFMFVDLKRKQVVDIDDNEMGIVCETVAGEPPRPEAYLPAMVPLGSVILLFRGILKTYAKISPLD